MDLLNHKCLSIIGFVLFVPFIASACGESQPGYIFVILSPIVVISFLFINRKYFFKTNRKIFILSFIVPLLIIVLFSMLNIGLEIREANKEYKLLLENREQKELSVINENSDGINQWNNKKSPAPIPRDIRSEINKSIYSSILLLIIYSFFMILYGIREIKKKNNYIGKKIIVYFISLNILVLVLYFSYIAITTSVMC